MNAVNLSPALYGANTSTRTDPATTARVALPDDLISAGVLELPGNAAGNEFTVPVPLGALRDPSIQILVGYELGFGGYEAPTRALLRDVLNDGDTFIDVGAHWGVFSLDVASAVDGARVIAIEPAAPNFRQLNATVDANQRGEQITTVGAAAGATPGSATLAVGISMTHRITTEVTQRQVTVPVVTIDDIFDRANAPSDSRVVLKIDVEGQELAALEGARSLIDSGRVSAIVWEYHDLYHQHGKPSQAEQIRDLLEAAGFRLLRFPHHHWGGALVPFSGGPGVCNVIAVPNATKLRDAYGPTAKFPPLTPPFYSDFDTAMRISETTRLRELHGADVLRWSDPLNLSEGARNRAHLASRFINNGATIIDIGAGNGALEQELQRATYVPVDLLAHNPKSQLLDVERTGVPAANSGHWDFVAALDVLPYLSAPEQFLKSAHTRANHLLVTYPVHHQGSIDDRLIKGWCQDWTQEAFVDVLARCGWRITDEAHEVGETLYLCEQSTGQRTA